MKKILLFIVGLLLLSGCSSKMVKLMKSGNMEQSNYKVVVPFEMRLGLIILKVRIEGEDYDFLFDTGAPNVVTHQLGEKLGLKSEGQNNTKGSQGHREKVDYAYIDTLQIGGINYLRTGTAIMDFSKSTEIECMNIDGILGANTMRNSIWQIDYQKQEMTLTSHIDSLEFASELDTIPFSTKLTGTPVLDITIGKVTQKYVTLDSGSGGYIDLHHKTYQEALKQDTSMPHNFAYGNSSTGIYGMGAPDTINFYKPDTIQFGTIELYNQICQASVQKTSSTLGTRFFKNYIITLDWGQSHLVLQKVKEYDHSQMKNLGYKNRFMDDQLKVGLIFNGSEAAKNLKLYDQVLKEDSVSYETFSKSDYCKMILDTSYTSPEKRVTTVLRGTEKITIPLTKSVFLK